MTVFFTADTHFDDPGIVSTCKRPFKDVIEMNKGLIERWNSKVGKRDTVYHLGDFGAFAFHGSLNGNIIFIEGNHDSYQDPIKIATVELETEEKEVVDLMHDPVLSLIGHTDIVLHGHVHTLWKDLRTLTGKHLINVGVDVWNFYPVTSKELSFLISHRELSEYLK